MSTISVPLSPKLEERLNELVKQGVAGTKAEVMRKALERLAEEEAIGAVLRAEREPTLQGDLRKLMRKIS